MTNAPTTAHPVGRANDMGAAIRNARRALDAIKRLPAGRRDRFVESIIRRRRCDRPRRRGACQRARVCQRNWRRCSNASRATAGWCARPRHRRCAGMGSGGFANAPPARQRSDRRRDRRPARRTRSAPGRPPGHHATRGRRCGSALNSRDRGTRLRSTGAARDASRYRLRHVHHGKCPKNHRQRLRRVLMASIFQSPFYRQRRRCRSAQHGQRGRSRLHEGRRDPRDVIEEKGARLEGLQAADESLHLLSARIHGHYRNPACNPNRTFSRIAVPS